VGGKPSGAGHGAARARRCGFKRLAKLPCASIWPFTGQR
jgi:hypothetical protein